MALSSVIVDSREPDFVKQLQFEGVPVAVAMLDAGDVLAATDSGELIVVERKAANDLLGTIRDERFFPQMQKIREVSPWAYLVITGSLQAGPNGKCWVGGRETGFNWWSIQGALITCQEMGVHVVQVSSDTEFEATVVRLANRDRSQIRIQPARDSSFVSDAEAILSAFPGIGVEKARAILNYCGTAAWALTFLTDDTFKGRLAPGVAEGTIRRIRRALELPDWGMLSIVGKDPSVVQQEAEEKKELISA